MRQRALQRLDEHQQVITGLLDQGEALLTSPDRDMAAIARMRWVTARALTAYQLFQHREIFDPALAGETGADPVQAGRMKAACTALGDDFRRHVQTWSATDVESRWATYLPTTQAMIARVRSHLARERGETAALLAER